MIPGLGRSPGEGTGYPLQYSWASLVAQLGKNLPATRETWVRSLGWEDPSGEGKGHPRQYSWASLVAQLGKNLPATWETWVRSLGREDPPGEGKGYSLQYSGLENFMDCIVHGVSKESDMTFPLTFHFQEEGKRDRRWQRGTDWG